MIATSNTRRLLTGCQCCPQPLAARAEIGRRNLLAGGIAALGLGASLGAPAVLAQGAAPGKTRIDVHHHFLPDSHAEALRKHKQGVPKWTPQMSIEDMDRNGIATALLSQVQPGTWFGNAEESRKLAREINDYGAKLVKDHPGRFGLFATISPPDVDGSLKEIEYALDTLKADGFGILTSYDGKYLGESAFHPVYEELNRRKAVIYVHPLTPLCCSNLVPGIPPGAIEYSTDSTRTIAHLVFSGTATKYPDIRWIFSHSGGTLPFLTARFVRLYNEQKSKFGFMPNGPLPEFQKLYYELAQGNTKAQIAGLLQMVSPDRVLYGTDFPYRSGAEVNEGIAAWGFKADDARGIERETALKLLPRLKTT